MKKLLLTMIFSIWHLYALEPRSTLNTYHAIFDALTQKTHYSVYTEDKTYKKIFIQSSKITLSISPQSADIILITNKKTLNELSSLNLSSQIQFSTQYNLMKQSDTILGAFYWRKGRAQIVFCRQRLQQFGIILPQSFEKYIIDRP